MRPFSYVMNKMAECSVGNQAFPAGWWRGEWDANDALGTNNGTLNGGVTFVPGKVGQAFDFEGTNAYVSMPASASLDVGTNGGLTMMCWFRPYLLYGVYLAPVLEWVQDDYHVGCYLWIDGQGNNTVIANICDTGARRTRSTARTTCLTPIACSTFL